MFVANFVGISAKASSSRIILRQGVNFPMFMNGSLGHQANQNSQGALFESRYTRVYVFRGHESCEASFSHEKSPAYVKSQRYVPRFLLLYGALCRRDSVRVWTIRHSFPGRQQFTQLRPVPSGLPVWLRVSERQIC